MHPKTELGGNCIVYQNVTLGSDAAGNFPVIGNCVTIYAGACVIGNVKIGNNVTIGANAVVISDVRDGYTAVGVPARSFK